MRMCRILTIILFFLSCLLLAGLFVFHQKELLLKDYEARIERLAEDSLEQEGKNDIIARQLGELRLELVEEKRRSERMGLENISLEKKALQLANEKSLFEAQIQGQRIPNVISKRKVICKKPREKETKERPIFIFVVGGEGTGHHLVANLLEKCPGVTKFSRHIQQLFAEMWEPAINDERRFTKRTELLSLLEKASLSFNQGQLNATHFVIQTKDFDMFSFPFDDPRNPLRRPDLLDLISIVEPLFDLRIVVTIRDQMKSIVSLIRRKWWTLEMCEKGVPIPNRPLWLYTDSTKNLGECGYIPVQARVVEDALIYISAHLQLISKEFFRTLRYEDLLSSPGSFATPLSSFLGLSQPFLSQLLPTHVAKKEGKYTSILTARQKETIETIFGGNRDQQWSFMMEERHQLLNYDPDDLSWKLEEECFQPENES